ncbi:hypothetical protein OQA88_10973 [Cercophora sp. LCS_1]
MFSSELSWAPVTEMGSRTAVIEAKTTTSPRAAPTSSPSIRQVPSPADNRSLRSSASTKNPSVFRWGKVKTSWAPSSTQPRERRRAGSTSGPGQDSSAVVWISTESVVEVREESAPTQRYELPASPLFAPSRQAQLSPLTSPAGGSTATGSNDARTLTRSPSQHHSPTSTYGSENKRSNGERWRSLWYVTTPSPPLAIAALTNPSSNRRPPEEWGSSSSRRSMTGSDYPDSSPRTTIASLAQSRSSVLEGLSPPPKSPGIHRPTSAELPPSPPPVDETAQTWGGLQTLVKRMTSASPSTRWNRATEEWTGPLTPRDGNEIKLEQQLWLLAELHIRDGAVAAQSDACSPSAGPVLAVQRPIPGRILDVCSQRAEVTQLAALQPGARIAQLAFTPDSEMASALPPNVARLPMPTSSDPEFPLGDASFDHVRVMPASVGPFSGQQLRALLRECQRVLTVGGQLEVRVVDPAPSNLGPASAKWVESELLLALESRFRCTRPAALAPVWTREAGLEVMEGCVHEFRVCVSEDASPEERLEAELGRWLLRCQYPFVESWLWELDACRIECLVRATKFRVVSVFGLKC